MKINRKRYIVTRNNRTEIFCGLATHYTFKPINDIGDAPLKTYATKNKAKASFGCSWGWEDFNYEILEVMETLEC